MHIASSAILRLRLIPLLVLATCASGSKVSSATGRRQLRGVQLDSPHLAAFQLNDMYAPAPAAAPIPASIDRETPPELLKDIPEPPPPPAQPPPEPPIPPLPPAEGTLVQHPPPLPSELSIYPEAATGEVITEDMDVEDGGMASTVGAMVVDRAVAPKTLHWGGQDGDHLVFNAETTHHPPIEPPHAPMHAPDTPPGPPNTTTTTTQTLFPVAATLNPGCAEEVQKALAAASAASPCPTTTTTTEPTDCASYCNGVCVEEKTRELSGGALETVTAQGPCYEKAATLTTTPPVKPLPVLEPPPPLPDAVQYVGLQRA